VVYQVAICGPDPGSLPVERRGDAAVDRLRHLPAGARSDAAGDVRAEPAGRDPQAEAGAALCRPGVRRHREAGAGRQRDPLQQGHMHRRRRRVLRQRRLRSGSCAIAHYCSGTLGGSQAQAITCTQQSDCGAVDGPNGLCTDVTNGQALAYAFDQVQQVLSAELGAATCRRSASRCRWTS
jgi:hypothetical protein